MSAGLRVAGPGDAAGILAIYGPLVRDTAISFEEEPPPEGEFAARIQATLASHPWILLEEEGAVAGFACATPYRPRPAYRWTCETSVYVAAERRRRGVGDRLYGALFGLLRLQGLRTAVATIALPNGPSEALHRRHGFEPAGALPDAGHKLGRWHAVAWWRKSLLPPEPRPPEPLPFPRLPPDAVARLLAESPALP